MENSIKAKILCVDDDLTTLDTVDRIFNSRYIVLKATSAEEAFDLLDQNPDIAVIISDQRMPVISGLDFLEKTKLSHPDTSRILTTGFTDTEDLIQAINQAQVFRFMTKPWESADLLNTVDQAFEKYVLKNKLENSNSELIRLNEELKNLDKVKNQFMMLINHELKTPLTTILSFSDLLKETILSTEQNLFTDRIIKSANKLNNIIEDVLLIVKGELGLIQPHFAPLKTENILNLVSSEVSGSIHTKNQKLVVSSHFEEVSVDHDLTLIALNRALHNATKFGAADSEIQVNIQKAEKPFDFSINIQNVGPIISSTIIEKIMKPFQLDENIMNHSVGMGLGLSICQSLMKAQNASLLIENLQNGVCVSFKFRKTVI